MKRKTKHLQTLPDSPCPCCGSKKLKIFFEMLDIPVFCNVFWSTPREALKCQKGAITLAFCPICSYIMNAAFEPALVEYKQEYESSLFFSSKFRRYARSLAESLIKRYELYQKDIISVGCGKGDFLLLLCELGKNRGLGFDPTYIAQKEHRKVKTQVKFIRGSYSAQQADYPADLIVCRQVLEHIYDPKIFLSGIRRIIGNRLVTNLFFEVPNSLNIFRRLSAWDIIYEHYSYFTPISLSVIFSTSGFQVCQLTEGFEEQFLCVYTQPSNRSSQCLSNEEMNELKHIADDIASFDAKYQRRVEQLERRLKQIECKGQRPVVWGAGSKGVTFLNIFKNCPIEYAVDINPNKKGLYIAGTGQKIVAPQFLQEYKPDIIIVMNPAYLREIQQYTRKLGLRTEFMHA